MEKSHYYLLLVSLGMIGTTASLFGQATSFIRNYQARVSAT